MNWWGWLIVGVNVIGFVDVWRWTTWRCATEFEEAPSTESILISALLGFLMAFFWPFLIWGHLYEKSAHVRLGANALLLWVFAPQRERQRIETRRLRERNDALESETRGY